MDKDMICPDCGHELSVFKVSAADLGERTAGLIADRVATLWFPSLILAGVSVWGILNVLTRPLEPYPIVTLAWISAVLATVAACQGPLILLAQRRAALHDRERDNELFRVATNTETDIHQLREAITQLTERLEARP